MKKIMAWLLLAFVVLCCLLTGCEGAEKEYINSNNNIEAEDIFGDDADTTVAADTEDTSSLDTETAE